MCRYYVEPGRTNTRETIEIALSRASELGIKKIVVASITGDTAMQLLDAAGDGDIEVIVIGWQYGLREPDLNPMTRDVQDRILSAGGRLHFATHALGVLGGMASCAGAGTAAETLKMFSRGTKVCVEMAIMCADAGLAFSTEEIICIGGTGPAGADTACVIQPAGTVFAWDREKGLRVRELLCKPR